MVRKRQKLYLFVILILTLSGCINRAVRTGSVAGIVVVREELSAETTLEALPQKAGIPKGYIPLANALVSVDEGKNSTYTNGSGHFLLDNIPEGSQVISIAKPELGISKEYKVEVLPGVINNSFYPVGQGYYVIIGVSLYANLSSLYSADCNAMEQFFTQTQNNVLTIRDQEATYTNIEKIINDLKRKIRPEDYLVIYFSGHGNSDQLALYNYAKEDQSDSLTDSDLKLLLTDMPTDEITLIIDSCYSGSLFDGVVYTKALRNTNYVILASSMPDQESYQFLEDGGLGFFTKHLLLGLINRRADYNLDHRITTSEIYAYTLEAAQRNTKPGNPYSQTPLYFDPLGLDPVLFRY